MLRLGFLTTLITALLTLSCSLATKSTAIKDPADDYLWLEQVQSQPSLDWVKSQNAKTTEALEALPIYKANEKSIREIVLAKDRLPKVKQMGGYIYNFWQDDVHVRGIWRRVSLEKFKAQNPKWELVLDIDQLSKVENENWVFKGSECLPPQYQLCMLHLSRGGKDASVYREFDTSLKRFATGGFITKEAKSDIAWRDPNTLLVASDFGPKSLTTSGYPKSVKIWHRGEPLDQAKTIFTGQDTDVGTWPVSSFGPNGNRYFVVREVTFYSSEVFEIAPDNQVHKIEKPIDAQFEAWISNQYIVSLRSDWKVHGKIYSAGSLVALPSTPDATPTLIFAPTSKQSVASVNEIRGALIITYLDSITGHIARAFYKNEKWQLEQLPFPSQGDIEVSSADPFGDLILATFESFLIPSSIVAVHANPEIKISTVKVETLKSLPARFDAKRFTVEQLWATSRDHTKIPYFFIHAKNLKFNGSTPTIIYGYGGFEISETPYYLAVPGRVWLENGGAYVVANIRGGGEFGPAWHQAALKEKRQTAFDDFIAVAEDVQARKISSPQKTAIIGGSNGGLLVGATFVERPDLYGAVVCQVPLLDMFRYNQLLAGASWEGEYGNPKDEKVRAAIAKYSPYQNVKPQTQYPEVFFMTSTADDRVHPGHARKMAAKMMAQGHKVQYFENTEGGHSAAANLEQRVRFATLQYTFLQNRLQLSVNQ